MTGNKATIKVDIKFCTQEAITIIVSMYNAYKILDEATPISCPHILLSCLGRNQDQNIHYFREKTAFADLWVWCWGLHPFSWMGILVPGYLLWTEKANPTFLIQDLPYFKKPQSPPQETFDWAKACVLKLVVQVKLHVNICSLMHYVLSQKKMMTPQGGVR